MLESQREAKSFFLSHFSLGIYESRSALLSLLHLCTNTHTHIEHAEWHSFCNQIMMRAHKRCSGWLIERTGETKGDEKI